MNATPTVTVIGDGQLARMMHTEAIELGVNLRLLAGARDSSAGQVIADVVLGDYRNLDDLRKVAEGVVTFDHEHVPTEHLHALIDDGIAVHPGPEALVNAQDKLVMREKLQEIGAPVPPFAGIQSVADADAFWDSVDGEVCLKATRGGYDGHGVWFPKSKEELEGLVEKLLGENVPLMGEQKVPFVRELSALVARRPSGEVRPWRVVESVQRDGICVEAIAPAPGMDAGLADYCQSLAVKIADELGVTGVLAVELFEYLDEDGMPQVAVNELAMRPHNTGHWTQDGCVTSQFEQHLRAVQDWPLGDVDQTAPVTVMANVLGGDEDPELPMAQRVREVMERYPQVKVHLYGKTYRAGRKIGHVNVSGQSVVKTREIARSAAHFLVTAQWL
ncbi:5-(carboxyamino)imidazole ribonucleotide synthase [Corynebacterium breve]|uniref:N5-carboxyaminoimidazole ribonucleotide synthase n=1 Tax=Corynebacterium breve TaxID=3049799 RepID=A0ABY8VHM4_9CORY|nr:5-(carboxyamino)imidazole ribonucleotide synthase [Corynebacterium breve]WIM68245.1 5-(carboxyamino)imidazole ribonucleotide synthase [Corynebacterium breve]